MSSAFSNCKRGTGLLVLFLAQLCWAQTTETPARNKPEESLKDYKISLDVERVILNISVVDSKGHPVGGLSAESFQVYEDGQPQKIQYFLAEDIPVTVGLVVDQSRSMQAKYRQVVAAALVFIRSSNPQDDVFLTFFNEHVRPGLPPGIEFTNDAQTLLEAFTDSRPDGKTALNDALDAAVKQIGKSTREKHVLVVVSDGGDNASKMKTDEVIPEIERSDAVLYTIGLADDNDPDRNPRFLRRLADVSGGAAYFPNELEELVGICKTIARDIRSQYTIGYTPTNTSRDGAYRKVKVNVRSAGRQRLSARTRNGYYGPSSPAGGESLTTSSDARPGAAP